MKGAELDKKMFGLSVPWHVSDVALEMTGLSVPIAIDVEPDTRMQFDTALMGRISCLRFNESAESMFKTARAWHILE